KITTESALLNSITKFIDSNATNSISSKDITAVFYVTAPYISILFKKYLGISFKHYVSSLKIGLSFKPLFQSNEAIHTISEALGFNHYAS
ncbi:helix-turn-helix transcriptional regulator, partial [Klebsiella pneumoniae]